MTRDHRNAAGRTLCALLTAIGVLALGPVGADDRDEAPEQERVVYVPPDLGAPPTRTLAAVRGEGAHPTIEVLAPETTGLTSEAAPELYWYLDGPTTAPVEVTLIDEQSIEPLLEVDLGPLDGPAVHGIDLAGYDVTLEPGVTHQWSVAQVIDPAQRSADLVATATLERRPPGETLGDAIETGSTVERVRALAGAGYWYDAIGLLAEAIAAEPDDPALRQLRADLLDQVGLGGAAGFDRAAASGQ